MLVQTEPTPMLIPQAQPQGLQKFTPMTGTQSDVTPIMNQSMGVALPQNVGVRVTPDAISLLITVGPEVPLFAQKKPIAGDQGEMSQSLVRRGVRDYVKVISSMGQTFDGSRPLMDLSPLVALPDTVKGAIAERKFVEGLRLEIGQMIKSHLICWQAKPIDEVLQYAKYCSDEIELKRKKLKEKAMVMVMQIKAAQNGVQGALVKQIPQQ
ncbi:hypothetical protein NDU88_003641 [Pleurodeles waltl]|uniref:Uncharacterized protein n=1 Tax=Pleurodeles waltl TaxID=8319 RepID=A0AAV7PAH4_PLEWA|nr:hypothetical protein NDU88_003641 [Pleurodeles waltl]